MSGAIWVKTLEAGRLVGRGRSCTQGQRRRPARLQDRQGRRQGPRGALPPRPGARALGRLDRRPGDPRAPSPPSPPGQGAHLGPKPDLRPADPVRAADLLRPASRARRDRAPGAPRGARDLARLDLRASRPDRGDPPPHRADRPRAPPDRSADPRAELLRRSPESDHCSASPSPRRSARSRALPGRASWSAMPALLPDDPVGRALGDQAAIEGRLADASLGGGRGRKQRLAADQPMPRALPADLRAPRQEPGEVLRRPQALDRAWHMLSRDQVLQHNTAAANSGCFLAA